MANFVAGIGGLALGEGIPSGWEDSLWDAGQQVVSVVEDGPLNRAIRIQPSGASSIRSLLSYTAAGTLENVEILAEILAESGTATQLNSVGIVGRGAGSNTSEAGYAAFPRPWRTDATKLRVAKYVSSNFTELVATDVADFSSLRFLCRFRISGTSLQTRVWQHGDTEPEAWTDERTDSSVTGAGAIGIAQNVQTSAWAIRVFQFAYATEGDTASFVAATTPAALTSATATSVTTTTATIGATTDTAAGTLYAVITTSATPPSAAQVKAGQNNGGTSAVWAGSNASLVVGANTFAATGLTADTAYHSYFVQDDGADSNVLAGSFSTLAVADETPPTLSSAAIVDTGQTITLNFSEDVAIGSGGSAGWTLSASGGASAMTYASGAGSTTLVYNLGRRIQNGETATIAYTQPGNGIEDASGNDLVTFSGAAVTNNSEYEIDVTPPTLSTAAVPTNGGSITLTFSEPVAVGSGGSGGFVLTASGGASAMTFVSGSGTSLIYSLGRQVAQDETLTLAYTQPGNGIEDASGNDLATFSGAAVTNNSTQSVTPPPTGSYEIPANTTPAGFKSWAELIANRAQLLDGIPNGTKIVLATDSQAIADAYPEFVWIVIE
jgi:uncharacterized repeat protein (TIGR02059 family)